MPIPTSPKLPRVNRGPSILAARIASPRHGPPLSSRYAPPARPSSLAPVSDEDRSDHSDSSGPSSLTSKAVDAVIANATRSPTLSFHSPTHSPPPSIQPLSALSSSLRAYSLLKGSAGMVENKEDRLSPLDPEESFDYSPQYSIIPYSVDGPTPRAIQSTRNASPLRTTAHSSTSSSHLSSMSSSPNSSISTSPSSVSPYPSSPAGSPNLPPPSVPRPIPGASDITLPPSFPLVPLSSSAPVASLRLARVEDVDDDDNDADLLSTQPRRSPVLKSQQSLRTDGRHQLLSKSKVEGKKEGTPGISSISSLINPASPSHPHHEAFKRSRRLSQSSLTESPRAKSSPSPVDPDHMIVSQHTTLSPSLTQHEIQNVEGYR